MPGEDPEADPLTDAQMELGEILNELFGRSRRQAAELAAILARLEQLKTEIRLHQAKLEARVQRE